MINNFNWTDLSTFKIEETKEFYSKLFAWDFYPDGDYNVAAIGHDAIAAIYTMPEQFQKLKLPSFWMSYLRVADIEDIYKRARNFPGAIVEIKPEEFQDGGQISLIRDPSGAGFTVYQGPDLKGKYEDKENAVVWNTLHVNDLDLVKSFYEEVFGFRIVESEDLENLYYLYNDKDELIATIEVISDSVKGRYQYWVPIFYVKNIDNFVQRAIELGGKVIMKTLDGRVTIEDPQGGSFMITNNLII